MGSSLVKKVRRAVEKYELFSPGDRVLVAVSGGLDSMVLLRVLYLLRGEYELVLYVAHYDHRLRRDSLEDALFVYREARALGLPFVYGTSSVKDYAKREGLSLEMAGRILRYRFFERLKSVLDIQKVALAHHADDLAEEVLLKFIRGAGRRGLAGIPIKREECFVRPLLLVSREEIREFAEKTGIAWREDPTNEDLRFLRNRVRHLLIPFLEKHFHSKVKETLKKTALILAEEEEVIEELAASVFQKASRVEDSALLLSTRHLKEIPAALRKRVFWIAIKQTGVSLFRIRQVHLESLEALVSGKARGPVPLPENLYASRGPGVIRLEKKRPEKATPFFLTVTGPGIYELPSGQLRVEVLSSPLPNTPYTYASASKLTFPLVVRSRLPGDKLVWPGISGHKKLKKFFWEKGIPPELRDSVPIVEKDGTIVVIPGLYVHPDFLPEEDEPVLGFTFSSPRNVPAPGA